MDDEYGPALEIVSAQVKLMGYSRISPESLQALIDEGEFWGWAPGVKPAYLKVMKGFRALLEPKGGW